MEDQASILIVDDNLSLSKTMSFVLGRKGYSVTTARDGHEAIEKVKESPFDIIFIDIKLPTINGLETYLAIREIDAEAVAIMLTAYHQEIADLVEEALRNNAYACLQKPLDMEEVLKLVDEIIKLKM